MTTRIHHWIDGKEHGSRDSRQHPVFDPARGEQTASVLLAEPADVDLAVEASDQASRDWGELSIARRQAILFRFRELLTDRKQELAEIITAEHGKVLPDALGEINRGLEVVEFALGLGHLLKGEFSANVSTGVDVHTFRQPLGTVAIISPFNFPAMVPMWFFPIALAAGNAVVLKPSEKNPTASLWLAKLLQESGLPGGVFNVVHGDSVAVNALLQHPKIAAVSFVGSTPIARHVYQTAAQHGKRAQALGGAKNHMMVLPDADVGLAADAAVNAGFGSAGERCMAISVVVAVEPIGDMLVDEIRARMEKLRVGDGRMGCDMGPLITRDHRDRVARYVDQAAADGATVVVDGRNVQPDGEAQGFWLGPTLLDRVPTSSPVYLDEIFGPVLTVIRVKTYGDGMDLINSNSYGNGCAIFTADGGVARRFQREVQVGMIGVNVPIPVPVAYHSFGGWKQSAFGEAKAYGVDGFRFFTQEKAITTRWLAAQNRGIDLGFPSG